MEAVATVVWMDCRSVLALWVRGMMVVDAVETVVQAVGYRFGVVATVIVEAVEAVETEVEVVGRDGVGGNSDSGGSGGSGGQYGEDGRRWQWW